MFLQHTHIKRVVIRNALAPSLTQALLPPLLEYILYQPLQCVPVHILNGSVKVAVEEQFIVNSKAMNHRLKSFHALDPTVRKRRAVEIDHAQLPALFHLPGRTNDKMTHKKRSPLCVSKHLQHAVSPLL